MNSFIDSINCYDFGKEFSSRYPSIYFQSQLHGNETLGTLVLLGLIRKLQTIKEEEFLGTIRIVPRVNPLSWNSYLHLKTALYHPPSGENWNRIFNWKLEKTITNPNASLHEITNIVKTKKQTSQNIIDKFKYHLLSLSIGYNFIIDVHTPENGISHLYCQKHVETLPNFGIEKIIEYGNHYINAFDDGHAKLYNFFNELGENLAITLELNSNTPATNALVSKWVEKFYSQLISLGIVKGHIKDTYSSLNVKIGTFRDYTSNVSGIPTYGFNLGEIVRKNSQIFSISPFDLTPKHIAIAEQDCFPLCIRKDNMIHPGPWVVRVWESSNL